MRQEAPQRAAAVRARREQERDAMADREAQQPPMVPQSPANPAQLVQMNQQDLRNLVQQAVQAALVAARAQPAAVPPFMVNPAANNNG